MHAKNSQTTVVKNCIAILPEGDKLLFDDVVLCVGDVVLDVVMHVGVALDVVMHNICAKCMYNGGRVCVGCGNIQ